jgi:hypothetical protein
MRPEGQVRDIRLRINAARNKYFQARPRITQQLRRQGECMSVGADRI